MTDPAGFIIIVGGTILLTAAFIGALALVHHFNKRSHQ